MESRTQGVAVFLDDTIQLQEDFGKIGGWIITLQMRLSMKKCEVMHFCAKSTHEKYTLGGAPMAE